VSDYGFAANREAFLITSTISRSSLIIKPYFIAKEGCPCPYSQLTMRILIDPSCRGAVPEIVGERLAREIAEWHKR
jgi:hypothetical protein